MSPHIATLSPEIVFFLLKLLKNQEVLALDARVDRLQHYTPQFTFSERSFTAPASLCLTTMRSGCIAFNVIAVSINVSPFLIELVPTEIFNISAPSFFPASSKEVLVLVEFSKNKFMHVLFLDHQVFDYCPQDNLHIF